MMRTIACVTIAVAFLAAPVAAQQPQRDTSAVPTRIGTATVSGRLTLGDTADTPVRRAVVTLVSADGLDPRSALTDDAGRFVIGGLPDGRYTLTAKKPAHLTSAFGAKRPQRPGTTIIVAAGQHLQDLNWTLPRGAVLSGRVTLEGGTPVPDTVVMAIPERLASAGGVLTTSETSFQTDDTGTFRIYGLLPGRYLLAVVPMFGRGAILPRTDSDYEDAVRTMRQTGPVAPGATASAPVTTKPERPVGFAPVYFPGTSSQADAVVLSVAAGDVKDGLDFTVSPVPMATLRGTIVDVDGQPVMAATISPELVGPPMPIAANPVGPANRPNSRGEFSIANMAPGRYRIRARAGGVTVGSGGNFSINSDAQQDWAYAEVTVTGEDIEGFRLTLQPGLTFSGRLATAGTAETPVTWKGSFVEVQPVTEGPVSPLSSLRGGPQPRSTTAADDGTFEVKGLEPGTYEIRVRLPASLSGQWSLASVRHHERDLRDAPLTFATGSLTGVEIVVTSTPTELSGRFTSESGTPATDYYIVAFPEDRALWHPASPRVRVMRPAADGLFSTRDLPPGTYRLAALTDVEPDEHRRAEFLESIYEAAIAVTVTAGTVTRQDVRIK